MTDPLDKQNVIPGTHQAPAPQAALDVEQASRLFETIGEGVCLASAYGDVIWANDIFRGIDQPTRERILSLCAVIARQAAAEALAVRLGTPHPSPQIHRREVTSSEDARSYEITIRPMPAAAPEAAPRIPAPTGPDSREHRHDNPPRTTPPGLSRLALVTRDVTDQVRIRRDMEAVERAGGELIRMDTDAVRKMNAVERLRHLEAKIVEVSRRLLHFDHFVIRLLDTRSGKLEPVVTYGLPTSIADFDIFPLPEGNGISGYVAATGQSYICQDTAADELFLPGLGGARSSLTLPLRLQDKILGIINVESQHPDAFDDDDRRLGEILARYIAMAFHMLDLLVAERSNVNQTVTGRVEGELGGPLEDIVQEVRALDETVPADPALHTHITRIRADVETIKERLRELAAGPNTILGVGPMLTPGPHDPAFAGRRVLVADDHARIRRIIGDVLKHRGCEVHVVDSGVTAIAALDEVRAGRIPPYDLVLSDIQMPDRNGYEVFSAAKHINPALPVILMTGFGYDPHHSIVRASQEGLHAVLFKPFPVERMLEEVRKALVGTKPV